MTRGQVATPRSASFPFLEVNAMTGFSTDPSSVGFPLPSSQRMAAPRNPSPRKRPCESKLGSTTWPRSGPLS